MSVYDPGSEMIGGFSVRDGTIDFYLRVNALASKDMVVLDLGAGRAGWFEDDICKTRNRIRLLKGKVRSLIAADVDKAVLENRASDHQLIIQNGSIQLEKNSVDLIVADYVLEHIEDVEKFINLVNSCLKSGGWFCARTPHKFSYVSLISSIVKNADHSRFLRKIQPNRKEIDVFPTKYRMNTLSDISKAFIGWGNKSFIFKTEPAYYFGKKSVFNFLSIAHSVLPKEMCGNLFVFVQKP